MMKEHQIATRALINTAGVWVSGKSTSSGPVADGVVGRANGAARRDKVWVIPGFRLHLQLGFIQLLHDGFLPLPVVPGGRPPQDKCLLENCKLSPCLSPWNGIQWIPLPPRVDEAARIPLVSLSDSSCMKYTTYRKLIVFSYSYKLT